jgi:hypothetical protein
MSGICSKCGRKIKVSERVARGKVIPYCQKCYDEEWVKASKANKTGDWIVEFALKHEECELLPDSEVENSILKYIS